MFFKETTRKPFLLSYCLKMCILYYDIGKNNERFGLDNQLIKTTDNKIRSGIIKEYRDNMLTQFNDIMHSMYNPKDQSQIEKSNNTTERLAFVFVVDITGDAAKFKQVFIILKYNIGDFCY